MSAPSQTAEPQVHGAPYVPSTQNGFRFTGTLATWVVILVGLALYLPDLARPFGVADINALLYLGPFAQIWETFGWSETRGMMIAPQMIHEVGGGWPYMQHPPGWFWVTWWFGTSEPAMRLSSNLGVIVAAVALLHLLRDLTWPFALCAALTFLGMPVIRVFTQVSLETGLLTFGLPFLLATARVVRSTGAERRRWRMVQILTGFLGPWPDWTFAWFCAGTVALMPWQQRRRALMELTWAAIPVLVGVTAILLWRQWAFNHPAYPGAGATEGTISSLIESTVLKRPPLDVWLTGCTRYLMIGNTTLIPLLALPGILLLLCRSAVRGPMLALLITGLLHPVVLADHATFHVHFYAYLCPALAAGCAAFGTNKSVGPRGIGAVIATIAVLTAWSESGVAMQRNHTTLFRDFGATMSQAVEDPATEHQESRRFQVVTNFAYPFPYYMHRPEALAQPIRDMQLLEAGRQATTYAGLRFLWTRVHTSDDGGAFGNTMTNKDLEAYLSHFPRRRLPQLEREYHTPGTREPHRIEEAWLYELLK